MLYSREFYATVQKSLTSEGLDDRRILRTFGPIEADEATEVLLVAHGRYAETIWVDPGGALIHGPIPGFGHDDPKSTYIK